MKPKSFNNDRSVTLSDPGPFTKTSFSNSPPVMKNLHFKPLRSIPQSYRHLVNNKSQIQLGGATTLVTEASRFIPAQWSTVYHSILRQLVILQHPFHGDFEFGSLHRNFTPIIHLFLTAVGETLSGITAVLMFSPNFQQMGEVQSIFKPPELLKDSYGCFYSNFRWARLGS